MLNYLKPNYFNKLLKCVFAVYVDVRYETKGTFSPDMLDNSRSYREFIGYVVVAKSSTLELTVNETLLNHISVVVLSVFILYIYIYIYICVRRP